jgi:hypothetical protein
VDERGAGILHLAGSALAAQLADGFDRKEQRARIARVRVREQAPVRIDGQPPAHLYLARFDKRPALAPAAEPEVF